MLVSSFAFAIGQIAHPFFVAFAWLLAQCYALVPSYAIAISLLTIAVMVVVSPITSRATRSMMKMQLLAPELKALRTKYATTAGMSAQERQEARQALNDEMLALYRANDVSPTGGCLPILLQLPIFWILYGTIRGLIHSAGRGTSLHAAPLYVSHTSRIYRDIVHAVAGHLTSFGMNLADSLRTGGLGWSQRGPYLALVLLAVGLQYLQMKQLSGRNRNPDASSVPADAQSAVGLPDRLLRDLLLRPGRSQRLLRRLEPLPYRSAGADLPTRRACRSLDREARLVRSTQGDPGTPMARRHWLVSMRVNRAGR
ncbi:MAG: 60 kDa inner rane insertion protein [Acidimicrobiaceae bacterium]|nr:60 kDa inner rane insertion protein [Acidimicrobiaceae bacterium]